MSYLGDDCGNEDGDDGDDGGDDGGEDDGQEEDADDGGEDGEDDGGEEGEDEELEGDDEEEEYELEYEEEDEADLHVTIFRSYTHIVSFVRVMTLRYMQAKIQVDHRYSQSFDMHHRFRSMHSFGQGATVGLPMEELEVLEEELSDLENR